MLRTLTVFAGLIAILVIGNAGAESKRRSTQQQIQVPSANPTQPPASDQRGTDQVPFTIKVIPSETATEKADREQRERRVQDEKAAVDKRLADEIQRLADETSNLATYTRWLAGVTVLLFIGAVSQIGLFVWQLRLIRGSLDVAKNALVSSNRPWIKVSISLFGPIIFEDHGATFHVRFSLKNIGMSPATTVDVRPCIILEYGVDHKSNIDIGAELERIIQEQKTLPKGTEKIGYSIFPNDEIERDFRMSVPTNEIEKSIEVNGYISPTVIGVVSYKYAHDSEPHYAGFIVYIDKKEAHEGNRSGHPGIFPREGNVLAENLFLWVPSIFGSYAD